MAQASSSNIETKCSNRSKLNIKNVNIQSQNCHSGDVCLSPVYLQLVDSALARFEDSVVL